MPPKNLNKYKNNNKGWFTSNPRTYRGAHKCTHMLYIHIFRQISLSLFLQNIKSTASDAQFFICNFSSSKNFEIKWALR